MSDSRMGFSSYEGASLGDMSDSAEFDTQFSINRGGPLLERQGTLLNVDSPTFMDRDLFCSFNKLKKAIYRVVNVSLSLVFYCFITGKTLDCLTPIYQTKKLFRRRFGGDNYPDLVNCIVYFFIGSDIFISIGALFLAKSRNRYVEKMKGLLDLARGKQPLLLDVDKLSYSSVLTSRNNAQIFIKDLEEESIRNIIKNKRREELQNFVSQWMENNDIEPESLIKRSINSIIDDGEVDHKEDVASMVTDYILKQADYPYKCARLSFGAFNIGVYCLYTWLKWDSLKGGITVFFGGVIPEKIVEIICISCLGAAWFYDIGAYLKNSDAIFTDLFKLNDVDLFHKFQNQRAKFWFRTLSVCNLTSTFLYWQTVEHDFGKGNASYLKLLKAFAGFYVNLCTKNYSLWPLLKGYFSNKKSIMHQFGEQESHKFSLLSIKFLLAFGVFLSFLRVFSKSGLSTLETSFTGLVDTVNMFPGANLEESQEVFYWSLLLGIPFACVNMLINWSWKTGPVLGQFMSGLETLESKIISSEICTNSCIFRQCVSRKTSKEDNEYTGDLEALSDSEVIL